MDTLSLLGFIVSTVALAMSLFAVVYARRQARAAELQVRLKLELVTRSRLIESLEISIAGLDPSQLNALVKSMFDRSINDLRITLLPAHEGGQHGFQTESPLELQRFWTISRLEPGTSATQALIDLRKYAKYEVDVLVQCDVDGLQHSWTTSVRVDLPPRIHVFP